MSNDQPLVSIVTPVYNGEKFLSQCIDSVLSQTYEKWEYLIVNNCSTDDTLKIAQKYAEQDSRIQVHSNQNFLDMIENWNHAIKQISSESKYCKVIHADDILLPESIEKMVLHAEKNPSAGIIGSYYLRGKLVKGTGIPYPISIVNGKEICRSTLRKDYYLFGSPTSTLIRSEIIRNKRTVYNVDNYHADVELCLDILQEYNFGFIHQVLSYTRTHEDSQSSTYAERFDTNLLENLKMLIKYGPIFLDDDEYQDLLKLRLKQYKKIFWKTFLKNRKKEYFEYHQNGVKELGITFGAFDFVRVLVSKLVD